MALYFPLFAHAADALLDKVPVEVLEINADEGEFDNLNGLITYTGNVVVNQGKRQLESDKLIIERDKEGEIVKITAFGKPVHFVGPVSEGPEPVHAYGDMIEFDPVNQMLYLKGDAKIVRDKDVYQAPEIQYDLKNEIASSLPSKQGRTQIVIDAKSLEGL